VVLIVMILLQQGKGADAGAAFGSGASGTVFGSRGSATFLSRVTGVAMALFMVLAVVMAYVGRHSTPQSSSVMAGVSPTTATAPTAAPVGSAAPPAAATARSPATAASAAAPASGASSGSGAAQGGGGS
jgi:preprotein translocase subunit SecG